MFEQSSESEVHFEVEIAIKVLRQAGYHSHAMFLAEKHMHHEWYLNIQLEDIKVKTSEMRLSSPLRRSAETIVAGVLFMINKLVVKNKNPESKIAPRNFGLFSITSAQ